MAVPVATIDQPLLTPEQEQEKWLGEAIQNVKDRAAHLRAGIKQESIVHVMRFASQMLSEMRTGMLTPQNYYELYVKVFDELQQLQMYFMDDMTAGHPVESMYELVQHVGNIVPRMYLLVTVGTVFIKSKQAPAKEILQDLVEMCKGVQHPTRGLFLRNYLLASTKNMLPDVGNEYDGEGGSVADSVHFILQNFKEMVWLWVRMDAKSTTASPIKREKERKELRILVGFNLVRLSQLDGIDKNYYQAEILPRILKIVLNFKEPMAQQYLMEVIVQVFPDEFHLLTLDELLTSLNSVVSGVDVHSILTSLMDRLGNYVVSLRDGSAEGGSKKEDKVIRSMFTIFRDRINQLMTRGGYTPAAFAETHLSLIKLVMKTYPGSYDRVDEVLSSLKNYFSVAAPDADVTKVIKKLMQYLMDQSKDINIILDLPCFEDVVRTLNFKARREIALALCQLAHTCGKKISTLERVAKLFDLIAPLVHDVDDTPKNKSEIYTIDVEEEFIEEQNTVSRVLHTVDTNELPVLLKMYSGIRKRLGQGQIERMRHTLKSMAMAYMRLAIRCRKAELAGQDPGVAPAKALQYIFSGDGKAILDILSQDNPTAAFPLYIAIANAADACGLSDMCYEIFSETFTIYEENAADTKDQLNMLNVIISALCALRSMGEEQYEIISTKVAQYTSKLVKKHHQARMASLCSHMFWKKSLSPQYHEKVLGCMLRAIKISDNVPAGQQLPLYVDMLNHFLYFYGAQAPNITVKHVSTIVELINKALATPEDANDPKFIAVKEFHFRTIQYIKDRQREAGQDGIWSEIAL